MVPDLFQTAYVPRWIEQLAALEQMALEEPWSFKNPIFERKNTQNSILEKYVLSIFRYQVTEASVSTSQNEADQYICIRGGYACFHTGLLTKRCKPIYGFLERNRRAGAYQDWVFKGFCDDSSSYLRCVESLPKRPFANLRTESWGFCPDWQIRTNVNHILDDPENLDRIPDTIRYFPNLYLLLEAGVEMARRKAELMPGIVVPQLYQGRVQYLLPICLHNPEVTDLAMTITPMEGFYLGNTCLTLEMAYTNARMLARPVVPWLTSLV